jgi:hypothetical protein
MRTLWAKFWRDDSGCIPATEWMLVASILTMGLLMATLALHHADERSEDEPAAWIR